MLNEGFEAVARWYLRRRGVRSRYVPTSKGRVHVLDAEGQGALPPILLLHGISSSSVPFGPLLLRLRRHSRRVLAPDTPGHGASDRPPDADPDTLLAGMVEAFDQISEEPVIVFGNSLGGAAALRLALLRPDRVRGVIACSPGGASMDPATFADFLARFDLRSRADATRFLRSLYGRPPLWLPLIGGEVRRVLARPFLRALIGRLRTEHLFTPEELRALTPPALVLWGRRDTLMMPEMLAFFRAHLAGAEVEEPEDFGHCPHLDHPGRVAARIVAFAQKVSHA